jgi:hypothetical protein
VYINYNLRTKQFIQSTITEPTTTPFGRLTRNSQGLRSGRSLLSAIGRTLLNDDTLRHNTNNDPNPATTRVLTLNDQRHIVHDVETISVPPLDDTTSPVQPNLMDHRQSGASQQVIVETVLQDEPTTNIADITKQIDDVTDEQHFSGIRANQLMYRLCNFIGTPFSTLAKQILANIGVETDTTLLALTSYNPGALYWHILVQPANVALMNIYPRHKVQTETRDLVLMLCRLRMLFLEYTPATIDPDTGSFPPNTGYDTLSPFHNNR